MEMSENVYNFNDYMYKYKIYIMNFVNIVMIINQEMRIFYRVALMKICKLCKHFKQNVHMYCCPSRLAGRTA